jgi:predicted ATP-grasp superfamily ATP-dependent carboligase
MGYIGVDMVVGRSEAEDAVIEINPRLTTSYVGLRTICQENLAQAMLDVACGETPSLSFQEGPVRFTPAGNVFSAPATVDGTSWPC